MPKKMLIDATHSEETRVVVVDGNKVEEFDFESENKRQLAGNIYLAKVTRVEPSLQAAFVDYGGNRHGFLAFSEIHPDYYQIPVADRQALLEEERAYAEAQAAKDDDEPKPKRRSRSRSRSKSKAEDVTTEDAKTSGEIEGMETVDLTDDDEVTVSDDEASSPMERVTETPVETPTMDEDADSSDADEGDDEEDAKSSDAASKDESIESVADEDDSEDIRPVRKPRPKRYKIQEVIKVRQILLVQVVKEERGNKGAALTTYLSLAGRYCVLMPNTARGGGISRKITNAADRKKLKEIANEIQVPSGAGLIVRTAGAKRTRAEIKRDYEYLQRLWEQIRELTLKSIAPAKIYEEGDLIKRSIRDLYNREIDEVFVEGERGYRIAKDFMKMIMPSHAKNVKRYEEGLPLFARYQVESYLSGMFNPTVQLPSGGYIVIGVTEALVAIDVNSGRATKEGSIEQTALKTNLEAADEVARQLRLRDLAGLIVIDFIDMDERKNNASVEKRMKDKLKTDRARIQVGRISGFGLMEMSRQRLRPGMIEATTQPCQACHGTGLIRSDDNLALSIIRQIEEEGTRRRSREVLVKCPVGIANFLMNQKREHIAQIEARYGLSVRIEGDPSLVSPEFTLEKFKTATRNVAPVADHIVSVDTSLMDQIDEDEADTSSDEETPEAQSSHQDSGDSDGEGKPKRRRRRRRSRGGRGKNGGGDYQNGEDNKDASSADENADAPQNAEGSDTSEPAKQDTAEEAKSDAAPVAADAASDAKADTPVAEEKPKPKTRSRSRSTSAKAKAEKEAAEAAADGDAKTAEPAPEAAEDEKPKAKAKPKPRSRAKKADSKATEEAAAETTMAEEKSADAAEEKPKPKRTRAKAKPKAEPKAKAAPKSKTKAAETASEPEEAKAPEQAAAPAPEPAPEPVAAEEPKAVETVAAAEPVAEAKPDQAEEAKKPKRRGWWSLGR
ncbi:Rne/Rng family ribonuclease [Sulfitobacter mediterraneus]|uniref:Rne/Rng family ribonuclease n=1 Tax=Sulfitobacter mediterraneus TaxID=83219 RepID=UPI001933E08B|nr:ribonuclease E/G [Sulfitobacter mediterraneus]MBM1632201.1 Rne/Rng family ribonuclease [Sulfitobacter mediterraneus]MBM1640017.1 Rne/Rng family ribonuclease [Sulfitobacter mediterraneus]MBM1644066.1 Rne/Rng family ribonuclease [Sulfitobacter mediterraneus]MBM1648112.1 Rne/Rng family ribonuclease [Sulfitobacter mediterraneus]MBM1652157.1 Rne/Rng family ribonuclease [Sulfitobacter mediterraneus]